jgi:hypothetical protein
MRQVDNRSKQNTIQRRTDRRTVMLKTDEAKESKKELNSIEEKTDNEIISPVNEQPATETKINNSPGIIQKQNDDGDDGDDDDGSGTGGKKKIKFKNRVKNFTRSVGKGVRNLKGDKLNEEPHGNIQTRHCIITVDYNAPNAPQELLDKVKAKQKAEEEAHKVKKTRKEERQEKEEEEKKKKKKGVIGYKNDTSFDSGSVKRYAKDGAGTEEKGKITWTYTGDFNPKLGESIDSFKSAKFHFDGIADQDSFTLAKNVGGQKEINENDMSGDMKMGSSHFGYNVHVESRKGLTELPKNSDWKYDITLEMKVNVPYTEDINGKPTPRDEDDEVPPDNKRPWWHKWWYGNKVPLKE